MINIPPGTRVDVESLLGKGYYLKGISGVIGVLPNVGDTDRFYMNLYNANGNYMMEVYTTKKAIVEAASKVKKPGVEVKALMNEFHQLVPDVNIGADPEVFCFDANGRVIPAYEWLPTKKYAQVIGGGGTIYCDGFAAEWTQMYTYCHELFCDNIAEMLRRVYYALTTKYSGATINAVNTVVKIEKSVLESADDEHVRLGCLPSLNVYGIPRLGVEGRELQYRSSGCHIHYGISGLSEQAQREVVRAVNAIGGVVMTNLFRGYEDPIRRRYYGRPGEYRLPKHGIEWRTPSSAILQHPGLLMLVLDLARAAMKLGVLGVWDKVWHAEDEEVVQAIGRYDFEMCEKILSRNEESLARVVKKVYEWGSTPSKVKKTLRIIMEGVKEKNDWMMEDLVRNWYLKGGWENCASRSGCKWRSVIEQMK